MDLHVAPGEPIAFFFLENIAAVKTFELVLAQDLDCVGLHFSLHWKKKRTGRLRHCPLLIKSIRQN